MKKRTEITKRPNVLTCDEVIKIRKQAEALPLRDQALLEFLISTGCRLYEVINLRVEDINLDERTATIQSPSSYYNRMVYLHKKCFDLLKEHLDNHPHASGPVFLSNNGKKLSSHYVRRIIRQLGHFAGHDNGLSPHAFRHTFATLLLRKEITIDDIQRSTGRPGHPDPSTTKRYVRQFTSEEDLKAQSEKAIQFNDESENH